MNMIDAQRLAVCSWSLQPTGVDDLIAKVRATGLGAVQLHLNPLAERAAGWEDAPARLRDGGIDVVSGMVTCQGEDYASIASIERTGGVVPDATWPRTREVFAASVAVARQVGVTLVTFHAGFLPHDPADPRRARAVARLAETADLFAAAGCATALETGQESADALLSVLAEVDRVGLGVNFDPANMILYGSGEPVAALRKLMPLVQQVHVKDAVASAAPGHEWGREVPVGRGEVDWDGLFGVLRDHGYGGDACVEREAGDARVADVREAVEFLRRRTA